jgi:small GTP-binding protein
MHAPHSHSHRHPSSPPMGHAVTVTTNAKRKLKCLVLGGAGAGKTSILRRYFKGNFQPQRVPTLGSDFYTRRIPNPLSDPSLENDDEKKMDLPPPPPAAALNNVSMQVWDTPGRERFAANRKFKYTAAFSDSFFKNADAALLVYDITSSTSFTQLLNWHYDLQERIRRLQASGQRTRPFPVLIVANKMDILQERDTIMEQHQHQHTKTVQQRNVMGLTGKDFRGKDSRYEYRASPPSATGTSTSSTSTVPSEHRNRFEISTYMGTGDKTSYLDAVLNNQVRGSYLESLLSTEDDSHPDKDMVLLWCMRNGLKHCEVSAKYGTGVDEMMQAMVLQALEPEEQIMNAEDQEIVNSTMDGTSDIRHSSQALYRPNLELDLHKRYVPKEQSWLAFRPFHWCCKP